MLAEVLYETGRFDEALSVVTAADEVAGADEETLAVLASVRATVLGFGLLRLREAVEVLEAARRRTTSQTLRQRIGARAMHR